MSVQTSEKYPYVTTEAIQVHVDAGTTEKRAAALILRDHGVSNAEGGEAFGELFGQAVKSGGFGNLVTGALRDVGRGGEIETTGTGSAGTRKAREVDPVQMLRDELDREKVALDNVEKPVTEAREAHDKLFDDPEGAITERQATITAQISALQAEAKALKADPKPYLDAAREKAQARLDAAITASGDRAKVHQANIERLQTVVTALTPVEG